MDKRQRERARKQKHEEKERRRLQRVAEKQQKREAGIDNDAELASIVPGPQPGQIIDLPAQPKASS